MIAHIDWSKRRDEHTKRAIDYATSIDFPIVLLVIYYSEMAAHSQMPCHYLIDGVSVTPITRKQAKGVHAMKVMYLPNDMVEVVWV